MGRAIWHTFQLLTKRHSRMRSLLSRPSFQGNFAQLGRWPLPNVWLGVSAEDQHWWGIRVPALVATPAAVRFPVPFIKQLDSVAGRELGAGSKGGDWDRWPDDLKVRVFPAAPEAVAAT